MAGAEVVQLYIHDKLSSVVRPVKELKGFKKVFLEPGDFEVMIGSSSDNIHLNGILKVVESIVR
jgi:hypothetical protein